MPIIGVMDSAKTGNLIQPALYFIQRIKANNGDTQINFTNIPQTYRHLRIMVATQDGQTSFLNNNNFSIKPNASGTITNFGFMQTNGGSNNGANGINTASYIYRDIVPSNFGLQADFQAGFILDIYNYSSTTLRKSGVGYAGCAMDQKYSGLLSYTIDTTAAITSIRCEPQYTFSPQSYVWLYGIKD